MNKLTLAVLSAGMSALAIGCNNNSKGGTTPSSDSSSSVAVVNLDHIAQQMGWGDEMNKNLKDTETSVRNQINDAMQPAINAANKKRDDIIVEAHLKPEQADELKKPNSNHTKDDLKKMGLSEKQIDELGQAYGIVAGEVNSANQQLSRVLEEQKARVAHAYVVAIQPVVRKVAKDNNKAVVLIAGPALLYNDSSADISDKIVDDMQHSPTPPLLTLPNIGKLDIQVPALPPGSSSSTPASSTPSTTTPPTTPSRTSTVAPTTKKTAD